MKSLSSNSTILKTNTMKESQLKKNLFIENKRNSLVKHQKMYN